jgi:uncharacterized repeat protein (TIGR01451 family)
LYQNSLQSRRTFVPSLTTNKNNMAHISLLPGKVQRAAIVLLLGLLTSSAALAQGFIRTYDSPWQPTGTNYHASNYQIFENPNGYTIFGEVLADVNTDSLRHFSIRHTDLNGTETQAAVFFETPALNYGFSDANEHGFVSGALVDTSHIVLIKNDPNGALLWQKQVAIPRKLHTVNDVKLSATGEIFVAMLTVPNIVPWNTPKDVTLAKLDADGNLLWVMDESNANINAQNDNNSTLTPSEDGGCFLHHGSYELFYVTRVDANGAQLWQNSFHVAWSDGTLAPKITAEVGNGGFMVAGYSPNSGSYYPLAKCYAPDGTLTWNADNLVTALGNDYYNFLPSALVGNPDGTTLLVGHLHKKDYFGLLIAKVASDGTVIWRKNYSDFDYQIWPSVKFTGGTQTSDGGYLLAGVWNDRDALLKIDGNGNLHTNLSTGTVAGDLDLDCLVSANDIRIPKAVLQATGNGSTYWAVSDSEGNFEFQADTGSYVLKVQPPSYLWQPCADSLKLNFPDTGMVLLADFPMQAIADCPMMAVDIFSPRFRRCFSNYVGVNYCNLGSVEAASATVTLTLDNGLDFDGSNFATIQNGQIITVELGTVAAGECGSFYILVTPNCDSTELGETKCVTAHITPDSICGSSSNWSGASIEATAYCEGDSVHFILKNTGIAPSSTLDYVIIDDHVIMMTGQSVQLNAGEEKHIVKASSGQTMRLRCEQEPGHPVATMPSVGVEGCGVAPYSQGFLAQFPNQTGSPFDAMVCREIIGSFDPNDKIAAPAGVQDAHFVEKNTELEYLINFQNTGTDTAFQVIIADTLSDLLDPMTIRGVSGSHSLVMSITGDRVLRFIFNNIMLPDSGANEAASQGFVRFKIKQNRDLEDGQRIENRAAIYFDFNQPIITNTVFHTIGTDFLLTSGTQEQGYSVQNRIQIAPNPGMETVLVNLENKQISAGRCRVVDCFGKIVLEQHFQTPTFTLSRNGLPAGVYFLEIVPTDRKAAICNGKLVWH